MRQSFRLSLFVCDQTNLKGVFSVDNVNEKVKRDTRKERIISLTQSELNDIVYYASLRASKKALDNHYNGLIPWFDLFERDHANMLMELEQIKLRLDCKDND